MSIYDFEGLFEDFAYLNNNEKLLFLNYFQKYYKINLCKAPIPQKIDINSLPKLIQKPQGGIGYALPLNRDIPVGYPIFGQYLAHDITFHKLYKGLYPASLLLNSLYGAGPGISAGLYVHYPSDWAGTNSLAAPTKPGALINPYFFRGVKLRLRHLKAPYHTKYDVVRDHTDIALMADNRNDQHFLILQFHVAMIRLHNAMVDFVAHLVSDSNGNSLEGNRLFEVSRSIVIHIYHQLIIDYLKKMTDPELIDGLLNGTVNFKLYNTTQTPIVLPEFVDAALRIGHTQISEEYNLPNDKNFYIYHSDPNVGDLRGYRDCLSSKDDLYMDWAHFFKLLGSELDPPSSSGIDTAFVAPLAQLPFFPRNEGNLIEKDLYKGFSLCSWRTFAECVDQIDYLAKVDLDKLGKGWENANLEELPLWIYLLLEAQIKGEGKRLGPLGSRIIAEQIIWVLNNSAVRLPSKIMLGGKEIQNLDEMIVHLKDWRKVKGVDDGSPFGFADVLELPDYIQQLIDLKKKNNLNNLRSTAMAAKQQTVVSRRMPLIADEDEQLIEPNSYQPKFNIGKLLSSFQPGERNVYYGAETIIFYFSRGAIATMLSKSEFTLKKDVNGISFFLIQHTNNLKLVACATNMRQAIIEGTNFYISGSNNPNNPVEISDLANGVCSLKSDGFKLVKGLTDSVQFDFKFDDLAELIFENYSPSSPNANISFNLFTGAHSPDTTRIEKGEMLNLYVGSNEKQVAYSFTHPKYCYYSKGTSFC